LKLLNDHSKLFAAINGVRAGAAKSKSYQSKEEME